MVVRLPGKSVWQGSLGCHVMADSSSRRADGFVELGVSSSKRRADEPESKPEVRGVRRGENEGSFLGM